MKKLLFVLSIIAITFVQFANAQSSAYPFVSSSGTYTEITGGTLLIDGTSSMDSWVSSAITIPSFTFNGVAYTTAYVTSNGLLTLGGSAPSEYAYTGISSGSGSGICICPFNADLDRVNTNATTEMRWETIGNEIVFQWKQMKRYAQTENFDFQVRLNTLSGVVSFVYQLNSGPGSGTSYQPQVGIRTSTTDFNNRLVASGTENWDTSLPGTVNTDVCRFTSAAPQKNFTSGLTYTWTPPTCLSPSTLSASNITLNSADLAWVENGSATNWNVQWGAAGFPLGSGTIVPTTTNPHALGGLSPSTAYSFYVQADCGGVDTSFWAGPYSFVTVCSPASIPYNEGFESITANDQLPACMAATSLGTKNLTYTASDTYNRIPHSGSKFASFKYAPAGNWFFFAPIQLISGISYDASVWYITDGATGFDALNIAYGISQDSAAMTIIDSAVTPTNTTYQQLIATFVPAVSGVYYIGIQANGTSYSPWYLTIDDIFVEETPSCVAPTALTADSITTISAQLGWTAGGTEILWNIELGLSGFIPTGTPTSIGVTNPYTDSSLTANTSYSYYVQADCGLGDLSTWTGPFTFNTLCDIVDVFPWSDDFEMAVMPANFICWTTQTVGGVNTWYVDDVDPQSGLQYAVIDYDAVTIQNEYLISPVFDFTSVVQPLISFWWNMSYYWAVDPYDNYDVYLLASTDGGVTMDTLWAEADEGIFTSWTWAEKVIDLSAYAGEPEVQFAFNYVGFDGAQFNLDNVTVDITVGLVKPIVSNFNVNIYPNPTNGMTHVVINGMNCADLTIYTLQGQTVYAEKLNVATTNKQLNLSYLPKGIYMVRISDEKNNILRKLILQ